MWPNMALEWFRPTDGMVAPSRILDEQFHKSTITFVRELAEREAGRDYPSTRIRTPAACRRSSHGWPIVAIVELTKVGGGLSQGPFNNSVSPVSSSLAATCCWGCWTAKTFPRRLDSRQRSTSIPTPSRVMKLTSWSSTGFG